MYTTITLTMTIMLVSMFLNVDAFVVIKTGGCLSVSPLYVMKPPNKLKKALWEDVDRKLLADTESGKTTGTVSVTFTQGSDTRNTMALPGQGLSEVATQADQFIKYKCKKGECGTCEVLVDGQWVRSCVTKIPGGVEEYNVQVRPSMVKSKKASGFFSVQSFRDGFVNNALGMVGLVTEGAKEDENFDHRMTEEERIKEMVRRKKEEREMNGN
ncbi:hypothetical protein TrCOL_g3539 [Triparma columacea]|uniref:2Fe-2S ferredoxin-type domain-containing protein n=1 Tax=Triparma columacea TaxID=722753 RepID=A0A9W7L2S1_9STRA|nr:hypothetical protein TrCOL_g3539 [Triparma columacea]